LTIFFNCNQFLHYLDQIERIRKYTSSSYYPMFSSYVFREA
jgi:hypothetical protein